MRVVKPATRYLHRWVIAQGMVHVSGTGSGNDTGGKGRLGTATEETRWALENMKTILEAVGSRMDQV